MMVTGYPFLKTPDSPFRLKTWFMPGTLMSGDMREVRADYLPFGWAQTARYLRSGIVDIAIVQVGDADAEGYHSLGVSVGQHRPMIDGARLVIAEVNSAMPRTCGDADASRLSDHAGTGVSSLPRPLHAPGKYGSRG